MSRQAKHTDRPVSNLQDLVAWMEDGKTRQDRLGIGSEHEKLVFDIEKSTAAIYNEKQGLKDFLERLASANSSWEKITENGQTIELRKIDTTESVSLEPAGQLEHATKICSNVHEIAENVSQQINEAVQTADSMNLNIIGLGYQPVQSIDTLPRIPKTRYRNFDRYMRQMDGEARNGLHVLYATASTQANIGYEDEADMVKKLRVSLALQPVVTALFANSPFKDGKLSGYKSTRSHIIHNAVGGRYGFMLPVAFEEGFGFERYAKYALNEMPMMGVYENDCFVDAKGAKFDDMMNGKVEACAGRYATIDDWEDHLNCIWPEVRVRQSLEMRGADTGPEEMIKALPALWVGLTYDHGTLDQAYEMVRHWSEADREYLRENAPVQGLATPFLGATLQDIAKNMLVLAQKGLNARNILDKNGDNEAIYLEPLHEIAESGMTWADRLISRYNNEWGGDLSKLFNSMAYKNKPSVLKSPSLNTENKDNSPKM